MEEQHTIYYSERGIPLTFNGPIPKVPTLTVECYLKWYHLFLVDTMGRVTEVPQAFIDEMDSACVLTWTADHCYHPLLPERMAANPGWDIDSNAMEMIVGRWLMDIVGMEPCQAVELHDQSTIQPNPAQLERLTMLIEEMAETTHVACKAIRYGIDSYHPVTKETNRVLLTTELSHVNFAQRLCVQSGDLVEGPTFMAAKEQEKAKSVAPFLRYNGGTDELYRAQNQAYEKYRDMVANAVEQGGSDSIESEDA